MIAVCNFCNELIKGDETNIVPVNDVQAAMLRASEFASLAHHTLDHMGRRHHDKADAMGVINGAMITAGHVAAMAFTTSTDPHVTDCLRVARGNLCEIYAPLPGV